MRKILENSAKETDENYCQISLNFVISFCSAVIKFLKSRVESDEIRKQQQQCEKCVF